MPNPKTPATPELRGWDAIAHFLGLPVSTAHRWHKSGMPVRRAGRYVYASPDELNRWLNRASPSHSPAHIAIDNDDLAADLKRALKAARTTHKPPRRAA